MHVPLLAWAITIVVVVGFIIFDFFTHVRTPHEPSLKEAGGWTIFYIVVALIFTGGVWIFWDHGRAIEFLSGYVTEKALSVDNLFVFALIIAAFKIPRQHQQKVLLFGIAMALVFRTVFIALGAAVISAWSDVFYLFAIFLFYTAAKTVWDEAVDAPEKDPSEMTVIKWTRKIIPLTDDYHGDRLTKRISGTIHFTPLAVALVSIGFIDLMFAFDSIPAIYGLTNEAFIVFTANALALMGLRQMYFLLDGLLDRLVYLAYGLGVVLGFIAIKLGLHALHENKLPFINGGNPVPVPEIGTGTSLLVIIVVLTLTVIASWIKIKRDENMGAIAIPRSVGETTIDTGADPVSSQGSTGVAQQARESQSADAERRE